MARKEKPVQYGTKSKYSKKRSIKMNSTATISRSNLESFILDSWMRDMLPDFPDDLEVDELKLDIPETVTLEVILKPKEVAH